MVIQELASAKKQQNQGKKNNDIYQGAFYTFGGLVTGFIFDNVWHHFGMPEEKITTSIITKQKIENTNGVTMDKFAMMLITGVLALSEIFGVKGGAASAGGMLMGYSFSNSFRKQKYIGQL